MQEALLDCLSVARLAQSAERKALNLVVVGSSPTVGVFFDAEEKQLRSAIRSIFSPQATCKELCKRQFARVV